MEIINMVIILADLIVQIASIEQIYYQKISEIINLFFGVNLSKQRVYDLFNKLMDIQILSIIELQEDILNGNIEFGGIVHYDEEYL